MRFKNFRKWWRLHGTAGGALLALALLLPCAAYATPAQAAPAHVSTTTDTSDTAACGSCHVEQLQAWQASDHARAMAPATGASVLGDFNATTATHHSLRARFSQDTAGYHMTLQQGSNPATRYTISHTFGHYPLQQYLTALADGHVQVLPFAWDTRPVAAGGQRWFTQYPQEDILPDDRLHWQQPLQNWNGMCADCHATGLKRNYDVQANRFATTATDTTVGCGSCHVMPPAHGTDKPAHAAAGAKPTIDTCFACHSLRAPLTDGIDPAQPFLDQFTPVMLQPPLYFADGQIREEVYVYGSFLQSRMHANGVTCADCHDPHSQKLVAQGNALCAQCHVPEQYDTTQHHHHKATSSGAQCRNCHMPSRTYMVVDPRRDHSFHIPRPNPDTPDACTGCHAARTDAWATAALTRWGKAPQAPSAAVAAFERSQAGHYLSPAEFAAAAGTTTVPAIRRASVIRQQHVLAPQNPLPGLATLLASTEPLVQLAAIDAAGNLPSARRSVLLAPFLQHPLRALRVAAAEALADVTLPAAHRAAGAAARAEFDVANAVSAWRGEGRMNQALVQQRTGDLAAAIASYEAAIAIDPYFDAAYVNLADVHRRRNSSTAAATVYQAGLRAVPNSPILRYAYALHLIRAQQYALALDQTRTGLGTTPHDAQLAYLHALLLERIDGPAAAVAWLQAEWSELQHAPQVRELAIQLARKARAPGALQQFQAEPPALPSPAR